MKIAIWIGSKPKKEIGGGFSYIDKLLSLIESTKFPPEIEIVYLCFRSPGSNNLRYPILELRQLPKWLYNSIDFSTLFIKLVSILDRIILRIKGVKSYLEGFGVKIIYYPTQCTCLDSNFPFISNNWDIGHLSTYSFPEVSLSNDEYLKRNAFYQNILPKALLTICESETGKNELLRYTLVGEHKIRVMPMFSGNVTALDVDQETSYKHLKDLDISINKYFFYPAQFWPHKNHYTLINAFSRFVQKHPDYKLVLSGSDKGNMEYINELISKYSLGNNIIFTGFISNEVMYSLYKHASALIMASHFGPTNMPPIEAMEIGCPVICSDLGGHREILGNSALYFQSFDVNRLYECMEDLILNRNKYLSLLNEHKKESIFNAEYSMSKFIEILKEAVIIRSNWQ